MNSIIIKNNFFNKISTLLIVFYYLMRTMFIIDGSLLYSVSAFIIGLVSLIYVICIKKRINIKLYSFILLLYILMIMSAYFTKNLNGGILFNIQYIGITFLLLNFKLDSKYVAISFYLHCLLFLTFIFLGLDPADVLNFSRNQISSIMIVQCILLYLSKYEKKDRITILPGFLTLIISAWSISRSGIISSLMLILIVILNKQKKDMKNVKKTITILFFGTIVLFMPKVMDVITNNISMNFDVLINRLASEGFGARSIIIEEYFNIATVNLFSIVFGGAIQSSYYIQLFDGNLHVSFLGIHAYYGLGGVILILFLMFIGISYLMKKKYLFLLGLFSVLMLRISTDSLAFPGYYDPLIYFILLYKYFRVDNEIVSKDLIK